MCHTPPSHSVPKKLTIIPPTHQQTKGLSHVKARMIEDEVEKI